MAVDNKGKNLPKGISLRKDGRYQARFQYEGESYLLYNIDLPTLITEFEDLKYEVRHGIHAKTRDISLDSWFSTWFNEYKENYVKQGTISTYKDCYKQYIKPKLGKKRLSNIRPEHIQKLYNDMIKKSYSKSTINLVKVILNSAFKQAVKNRIIQRNPVEYTNIPRVVKREEQRVLSQEEQKIFLKYAEKSNYILLYRVALLTGMRIGELRALEWKDIDFKKSEINVNGTMKYIVGKGYQKDSPKTSSSKRSIPMLEEVSSILKGHKKRQYEMRLLLGEEWKPEKDYQHLVFTNTIGKPLSNAAANDDIRKIVEKINNAGIEFPPMSPHTLRHTFATRGIEAGILPKVMQDILGHSSLSMTMDLYAHVLPDKKASEMRKLSSI